MTDDRIDDGLRARHESLTDPPLPDNVTPDDRPQRRLSDIEGLWVPFLTGSLGSKALLPALVNVVPKAFLLCFVHLFIPAR
jgi:hypothetical protein